MSKYETTFVIDSLQKTEDMENTLTKVQNFIKNNGGEISEVENWGKKRLAYEINRKQYGYYYQIHFDGPASLPGLLEREYRLDEAILRFLTIKSHPKAVLTREEEATETKDPPKIEASSEAPQPETSVGESEPATEAQGTEAKEEITEVKETKDSTSDL